MSRFVLCYDLSDDRERARVERLAERFGIRLQKSVFWCVLADSVQRRLLETALRELCPRSGSVLLIPAPAWRDTASFGAPIAAAPDAEALLILA